MFCPSFADAAVLDVPVYVSFVLCTVNSTMNWIFDTYVHTAKIPAVLDSTVYINLLSTVRYTIKWIFRYIRKEFLPYIGNDCWKVF